VRAASALGANGGEVDSSLLSDTRRGWESGPGNDVVRYQSQALSMFKHITWQQDRCRVDQYEGRHK